MPSRLHRTTAPDCEAALGHDGQSQLHVDRGARGAQQRKGYYAHLQPPALQQAVVPVKAGRQGPEYFMTPPNQMHAVMAIAPRCVLSTEV